MSDDNYSDADEAFQAMLSQPATRGELLQITGLVQTIFMGHSLAHVAALEGDEGLRRDMAERTIDQASRLTKTMKDLLAKWTAEGE